MSHPRLRIALCHFHLRTGGVTRVIEHCLKALSEHDVQFAVLTGEAPSQVLPRNVACSVLPGFAYEETRQAQDGAALAKALREAARELLGGDPDIWHFHNHSLGKNLAAPLAIRALADSGQRVLLQIHDFAEDGRPALYRRLLDGAADGDSGALAAQLYPIAQHIHYAVLNGRDQRILRKAGIPQDTLHLLPNAVWLPRSDADASSELPYDSEQRLWLYPTRAIRRKNLGELLFWSALGEKNDLFATTQAPLNPAERPVYERWKGLANELSLPMAFELGMDFKGDFLHLLKSAHSLLSTSITEGFGLAFLEPWLVERPLVGRNLPEITADFGALGIDLDPLYTRLPAPLAWLDSEQLKKRIASGLKRAFEAYGRQVRDSDQQRAWAAFVHNDEVDFGRLDEPLQEIVLRRLVAAKNSGERPGIAPLTTAAASGLIEKNRRIIDDQLSLERYAQRLMDAYTRLLEAPCSPIGGADGPALLDAFLAPERLFLLKT